MRKIKFRAWDKKAKGWINPDAISITLSGKPMAPDETWLKHDLADLVLMQFTGLFDKDGKEIWESDIVRDWEGNVYVVAWHGSAWWLFANEEPTSPFLGSNALEVLGNIYENPGLIGEKP